MQRTTSLPFLIVLPFLMTSLLPAQQGTRVDDNVLKNTPRSGDEWLTYGQNPGETRYSPLKQIDATNVSRLGLAWSYDVGQGGGNQEATPLVWNGTLFSITNWSVVFALDARTGKERWRWDPEVNQTAVFPRICCGVVNRGSGDLRKPDHRANHRRKAGGAGCRNREGGLGIACLLSAGQLLHYHGAAHREGKGDCGRQWVRVSGAWVLFCFRCQDRPVCVEVLHRARRSVQAFRECGHEKSCRDVVARGMEDGRRRYSLGRNGV